MNTIETENLEFKQYQFVKVKYFGYQILINKEDKYINITKLLNIINEEHRKNNKSIKNFYHLITTDDYKEFEEELKKDLNEKTAYPETERLQIYYKLNEVSNEFKGTYIHEDLLNYVLMWADKKYAIKISRILKELNNNNINKVNELVEELRNENNRLKYCSIQVQTNELSNNSKIKLYKSRDDKPYYKLSYDQDKTLSKDLYVLTDTFIVNSASNILKSDGIKQFYNKDKSKREFYENNLKDILNYIKPSIKIHQN